MPTHGSRSPGEVTHETHGDGELVVRETQSIVFREPAGASEELLIAERAMGSPISTERSAPPVSDDFRFSGLPERPLRLLPDASANRGPRQCSRPAFQSVWVSGSMR